MVAWRPLALLSALAVLAAASPGCGVLDRAARGGDRRETGRDRRAARHGGRHRARRAGRRGHRRLGTPGERSDDGPFAPLGERLGRASLSIALPPGQRAMLEVLRYSGLALLVADERVFAAIATGRATTASGVGVGSPLAEARAAFPGLRCVAVERAEPLIQGLEPDLVQRCRVRLGPRLRLGFVGDPIESVTISTTGLGI